MVLVEVVEEIFPQVLAEGVFEEAEILPQRRFAEGGAEEFAGAENDVVLEPLAIQHGDDAVLVGDEGEFGQWLAHFFQKLTQGVAGVGEDEAGVVGGIAAHHAADGIGEEGGHVAAGVGAGEGDLCLGHFGLQLAVETVGGDEEPVVLRLQLLHPADGGGALRLPLRQLASSVAPFSPGRSNGWSRKSHEVSKLSQSVRPSRTNS